MTPYLHDNEDAQLRTIASEEGGDDTGVDDDQVAQLIAIGSKIPQLELDSVHGSLVGFFATKVCVCMVTNLRQEAM